MVLEVQGQDWVALLSRPADADVKELVLEQMASF